MAKSKRGKTIGEKSIDTASQEIIKTAQTAGIGLSWDRYEAQYPQCRFGLEGTCCRICFMGPCRIIPNSKRERGACGATVDTVVARIL